MYFKKILIISILSLLFNGCTTLELAKTSYLLPIDDGASPGNILGKCVSHINNVGIAEYNECSLRELKHEYYDPLNIKESVVESTPKVFQFDFDAALGENNLKIGTESQWLTVEIRDKEYVLGDNLTTKLDKKIRLYSKCSNSRAHDQKIITKVITGCNYRSMVVDADQLDIDQLKMGLTYENKMGRGVVVKNGENFECSKPVPILVKVQSVSEICQNLAYDILPDLLDLKTGLSNCTATLENTKQTLQLAKDTTATTMKSFRERAENAERNLKDANTALNNLAEATSLDGEEQLEALEGIQLQLAKSSERCDQEVIRLSDLLKKEINAKHNSAYGYIEKLTACETRENYSVLLDVKMEEFSGALTNLLSVEEQCENDLAYYKNKVESLSEGHAEKWTNILSLLGKMPATSSGTNNASVLVEGASGLYDKQSTQSILNLNEPSTTVVIDDAETL